MDHPISVTELLPTTFVQQAYTYCLKVAQVECVVTLSYTPNETILVDSEWTTTLRARVAGAKTPHELWKGLARDLRSTLSPRRLVLKLDEALEGGAVATFTFKYVQKKRKAVSTEED